MGESSLTRPNSRSQCSRACCLAALACSLPGLAAPADSVLSALAYGSSCSSTVVVQNLADTPVDVELEAHRSSGALVPLAGLAGRMIHLAPGEQGKYQLQIQEEESGAWVQVRERAAARATPTVAVSGTTECRQGNQLRSAPRQVVYPTRNAWFAGEVTELRGAVISLINVSAGTVRASLCYSMGTLFSVPGETAASRELKPVCTTAFDIQVPPFGTRDFPVEREGNTYFSLKTRGDSVVLQILRPSNEGVRIYTVDSSIKFGGEVTEGKH